MVTTSNTDSQPLRERWLPQTSIRFFMLMIVVCAVGMVVFREAIVGDSVWAKIVALLIEIVVVSFISYVLLFFIANVFSATTDPIINAMESSSTREATRSLKNESE